MRREDTLLSIYDAALRVFAKYGFKKATVEDIADELGMTKGNLYFYVKNKHDLYEKSVSHGLTQWQLRVKQAITEEPDVVSQLVLMFQKGYQYLSENADLLRVLINDPSILPLSTKEDRFDEINQVTRDMLRDVLNKGIKENRFRDINTDNVTTMLYFVFVMFIIKIYFKSEGETTIKMFEDAADLLLHGLIK